jgi:phosphatidate phosphatase APP1
MVDVTIDGARASISSDRGGVLDASIPAKLSPGWSVVTLGIAGDNVDAPVFVVDDKVRFGILSDVDDTVMVTTLPRPLLAAWNTFVLDEHARRAVAGMAVLYDRLRQGHPGSPVIYLSTGAWNVVPTLTRFLERNIYPRGALLLTDWGPTHDRWFRNGQEHKAKSLERLAREFPKVSWLLIGDDGQHDERIYGDFAAAHPQNVTAVAIRRLTPGEAVLAGGRSGAPDHGPDGVPWLYADDGASMIEQLGRLGLLAAEPS